jgi:hypothetical protein
MESLFQFYTLLSKSFASFELESTEELAEEIPISSLDYGKSNSV